MNKNLPWCRAGDGDRDEQGAVTAAVCSMLQQVPNPCPLGAAPQGWVTMSWRGPSTGGAQWDGDPRGPGWHKVYGGHPCLPRGDARMRHGDEPACHRERGAFFVLIHQSSKSVTLLPFILSRGRWGGIA